MTKFALVLQSHILRKYCHNFRAISTVVTQSHNHDAKSAQAQQSGVTRYRIICFLSAESKKRPMSQRIGRFLNFI